MTERLHKNIERQLKFLTRKYKKYKMEKNTIPITPFMDEKENGVCGW